MDRRLTASEIIIRQSFKETLEGYLYFKDKLPELDADQHVILCVAANIKASGATIAEKLDELGNAIEFLAGELPE